VVVESNIGDEFYEGGFIAENRLERQGPVGGEERRGIYKAKLE